VALFSRDTPEPAPATNVVEKRSEQRFPLRPEFQLKSVLSVIGRDDTGAPRGGSRQNWAWKGRLVDFSGAGARMQLGPGVRVKEGDSADLILTVEDLEVKVPSRVSNVGETPEGVVVGLQHMIESDLTWELYRRLLEVVSLGSTLEEQIRAAKPDEQDYLVDLYSSSWGSRLTIWRDRKHQTVVGFEFLLHDGLVRGAVDGEVEYLSGLHVSGSQPATDTKAGELHRLFQWVVPNLAEVVPDDVREFLRRFI
jgi:hypothetical protein